MSGEEERGSQRDFALASEAQVSLFQAVKSHTLDLETTCGVKSGPDLEILDSRIKAARRLLEWLSQVPELQRAAFPAAQKPPPSSFPTDLNQIPPSAPDSPKTSRQ
jgi:hypothetical protein